MSLGERFREAREQRGLTLSEVAEQIRIRSVYLAAIEEENWSTIGAPVYTRGFLRTYARFLGLDPEEAVAGFNAAAGTSTQPEAPAALGAAPPRSLRTLLWVAGIVAAALVGFVIFLYVTPPRAPERTAAVTPPAAATPAPAQTAAPTPAPPVTRTLALQVTDASWLRVTVDGNVSMEGTFPAGTSKTFHGRSALVRVGNAGGVDLTVDGKRIGKLGRTGDVVERAFSL